MHFSSKNIARLAVGLIQGVILCLLYEAPHMDGKYFVPLALIALVLPSLIIINLGNMKTKTILKWIALAALLIVGLGIYDAMRRGGIDDSIILSPEHQNLPPSFSITFFILVGLFIGQSLIMSGDAENRLIASYPRYFDVAWKLAVQINFSIAFVGCFWLILWLGSEMFLLIKVSFFETMIKKDVFAFPATMMAFAYAIHVTDIRVNLVRGIRTLKLNLMSWLLPIITFFVTAFILTLPFKGIDLLWATHHTSQILLAAATCLIILINATYQDGTSEHRPTKFLRYSGTLGAVILTPLIAIAIYSLSVRVNEYGWTVHLIEVASCLLVATCYAMGYFVAAVTRGSWLHRLEMTNIVTSFIVLAILLSLFTPLADPARLSVNDQMSRLKNGAVSADKFDYFYLKEQGASYGLAALNNLKNNAFGDEASTIKENAATALNAANKWQEEHMPPKAEELASHITVYPAGQTLPETFLKQNWSFYKDIQWSLPQCLFSKAVNCEAFIIASTDNPPHVQQIILMANRSNAMLFKSDGESWTAAGVINQVSCKGVYDALKAGQFKIEPFTEWALEVAGMTLPIRPNEKCPP